MPDADLVIRSAPFDEAAQRMAFQARLAAHQIDVTRVRLEGRLSRSEYLAAYADVDIMLDPFPYNGGTTTCEALYMGVPTLTLRGRSMLGRQGASLLENAGLYDWIAENEQDYVEAALRHATDVAALEALRSGLRQRALSSPLFDAAKFARHFEDAITSICGAGRGD